ncbi:MAG: hypothetical protein ABSG76_07200 [Xanthobacteraceae bacterium]
MIGANDRQGRDVPLIAFETAQGENGSSERSGFSTAPEPIVHAEFDRLDVVVGTDVEGRISGERDVALERHILRAEDILVGFEEHGPCRGKRPFDAGADDPTGPSGRWLAKIDVGVLDLEIVVRTGDAGGEHTTRLNYSSTSVLARSTSASGSATSPAR